jgi:NADH-quinone oxidoreductase subunit J
MTTLLLAAGENAGAVSTGEAIAFWILGPIALAGALGMVFARNAVHSALWLVLTMLTLGAMYMAQQAPFLGFTQIIVYTGAVMMLFLFVLMLVGRDSSDSVVEVLRGQRLAGGVLGVAFVALMVGTLANALPVSSEGLGEANGAPGGNVGGLGRLIFTEYLFPFELTSALLITAALGAMLLAFSQSRHAAKKSQRQTVEARLRGEYARISPLPGPGVFATANSVATPALLPDGTVAPESLSELLESVPAVIPAPLAPLDAHALTGARPEPALGPADGSRADGSRAVGSRAVGSRAVGSRANGSQANGSRADEEAAK